MAERKDLDMTDEAPQWAIEREVDVERVADAIEKKMGPVFGSPEYLADPVKLARAEKRRRDGAMAFARAAIAAMTGEKVDG